MNLFEELKWRGLIHNVTDEAVIEKLNNEIGEKVNFEVLFMSDGKKVKAGTPVLKNVVCEAEVIAHGKDSKIVVFKYKAKKNERKKQGHRQPFTRVKILSIKQV